MTKIIPPQNWMQDPACIAVMQALTSGGSTARFVGGCVRDALLGRPINDVDIATDSLPEDVIGLLEDAKIRSIPTGLKHGTVTAVIDHKTFEITTLRHDIETFGRHANVAFSASWQEDAARRDFTMNAISLDLDGTLHDYFNGYEDAKAGIVRFVGTPTKRLKEDYLRLLRYFRFHAYYGKGTPDHASLEACINLAGNMKSLSGERIQQETLRLFKAPNPISTFEIMVEGNIYHHLFTDPAIDLNKDDIDSFKRYLKLEKKHNLKVDSLCRMAVLFKRHLAPKQAKDIANRLVLSNRDADNWQNYITVSLEAKSPMDTIDNYQLIDRFGGETVKNILAITAAVTGVGITPDWWTFINEKSNIPFPIQGRDALNFGIPHGPTVGEYLKATRLWWLEAGFVADKEQCLGYLKTLIDKNIQKFDER